MRAEEIREMTPADIQSRVAELEEERFRLRFRSATEALENPLRLRTIRRDIARLKTVLTEKASGKQVAASKKPAPASKSPKTKRAKSSGERVKNG